MSKVTPIAPDGRGLSAGVTYNASQGLITYRGVSVPVQTYEGALAVVQAIDSRQPVSYQDYSPEIGAVTRFFDPATDARGTSPANLSTVVTLARPENPAEGVEGNPSLFPAPFTRFDEFGNPRGPEVTVVDDPTTRVTSLDPVPVTGTTVPRDDPQAGEFEAGQFVTAQRLRTGPEPITVLDPETGLEVETLDSIEARQQFRAQETGISPYGEEDDALDLPADVDTAVSDTTGYIVADGRLDIPPDGQLLRQPTALGGDFSPVFDPDSDSWGIFDNDTGEFIQTGLTEEQARTDAAIYSVGDPNFAGNADDATDPGLTPDQVAEQSQVDPFGGADAAIEAETRRRAQEQAALKEQQRQINLADWRVRLTLAPEADYLYMDPGAGEQSILYPLKVSNGVVFPYTPRINTSYRARYDNYDLTHSNYRGYFYQGSNVDSVSITATFTAQDTAEANYVLAVIHFFRSVTRMFYGANDPRRGTPPPLVFLRGLGQYQFNEAPCVVSSFNYNLPDNVDYIRAGSANTAGLQDLNYRRNRASLPTNVFTSAIERLTNAGIPPGAEGNSTNRLRFPDKIISSVPVFGMADPTYVPTKIEIEIELLPMQSRQQISREYNFGDYASGKLITRGYW